MCKFILSKGWPRWIGWACISSTWRPFQSLVNVCVKVMCIFTVTRPYFLYSSTLAFFSSADTLLSTQSWFLVASFKEYPIIANYMAHLVAWETCNAPSAHDAFLTNLPITRFDGCIHCYRTRGVNLDDTLQMQIQYGFPSTLYVVQSSPTHFS